MGQRASCCEEQPPLEALPEVVQHSSWPSEPDDVNSQTVCQTVTEEGSDPLESLMLSRRSRNLFTMRHFKIDQSILRGIPLRTSLKTFGSLWVRSPVDLKEADRAGLWEKSRKVEHLDTFLSHTWQTSGWQKFLALMMQSGALCFLVGWVLGAVLGGALDVFDILPPTASYECLNGTCERGIWIWCGGFLGSAVGILMTPHVPKFLAKAEMCFLDVVSINQVDPDLRDRGIYGLGGFLAASSELRILWSPPYLSRLWCVFELAAFRKANPYGKVVLTPLFLETFVFFCILGIYGIVALDEIRFMIRLNEEDDTGSGDSSMFGAGGIEAVVGGVGLLPTIWIFHIMRRLCREKSQLINNLRNFDLDAVHCRTQRDRDFIYSGIKGWYGSIEEFTEHVRGPLATELTEQFAKNDLPITSWLMLATPFTAATLDFFVSQCQSDVPHIDLPWIFLNRVVSANLQMLLHVRLVLYLSDRFSAPEPSLVRDYAKTLFLWLVEAAVVAGSRALNTRLREPASILTIASTTLVLSILVFGASACSRCCTKQKEMDDSAA